MTINDDVIQVNYTPRDEFYVNNSSTNIFVATFTTSHARLRLYEILDNLGGAVVYYDTDGVIFIDDGFNTVETADMLGEWSSELADGDYITEWLSTGPKSYYFKTLKG